MSDRPDSFRILLRYATQGDLTPALGYPGGSCQLQERIRDEVSNTKVQDYLIDLHQNEQKFKDSDEEAIYGRGERDIGHAGKHFEQVLLRPHAQHRMDVRHVKVQDIKEALRDLGNNLSSERRQLQKRLDTGDLSARDVIPPTLRFFHESRQTPGGAKYTAKNGVQLYLRLLRERQERGRKKDKRGKPLMVDKLKIRVESAFWRGGQNPDPMPEDECPHFTGDVWEGYAKEYPESGFDRLFPKRVAFRYAKIKTPVIPGVQTYVSQKSVEGLPTDIDREKEVVLPLPGSATPGGAGRLIPQFSFSGPDSGTDLKPRTLGIPGEEYGHPTKFDYNTVTRRSLTADSPLISMPGYGESSAALPRGDDDGDDGDDDEGMEKSAYRRKWQQGKYQRKSRGRDKHKRQQYYRKNKAKIKMNQKRWRTKNKNKPAYKQWSKKRRTMNRRRRVASALRVSLAYQTRQASVLTVPDIAFVVGPDQRLGYVHSISPMSGMVTIEMEGFNISQLDSLPVGLFMRMAGFLTEKDSDAFFALVDVEIGPKAYEELDDGLVRECARRYDLDPESDAFKDDCFDLTGEHDLSAMSADQLEVISTSVVQEALGGGVGRSTFDADERSLEDADNKDISEVYDPKLFYGEVNVER